MPVSERSFLSVWNLLAHADFVVKGVMLVLVLSSVASWAIIWEKFKKMNLLWRESSLAFDALSDKSKGFQNVSDYGAFGKMMFLAQQEKKRLVAFDKSLWSVKAGRLNHLLSSVSGGVYSDVSRHMGLLASIGSSAVFVGLLGTVWGIMNSFRSIASSQNTSLSVVAPGISEALFVTAAGLLVAIPAMVAYNRIMDNINRFMENMDRFSQDLLAWFADE